MRVGFGLAAWLVVAGAMFAADPAPLTLTAPTPHQVVQREGFEFAQAHAHAVDGPRLGVGKIVVSGRRPNGVAGRWEWRTTLLADAYGRAVEWTRFEPTFAEEQFTAAATVPAGGWYRLEVRCVDGDAVRAAGAVEPVGVGEVLLIAGQSYAAGANDELLRVAEPQRRVAAYDIATKTWRVADDPQPLVGDGGTIWPPLGDLLVPVLRVPVGFVNVSAGGTSSAQWLPGTPLFLRLRDAGKEIGRCRAILWQQGESDVINRTSTEQYVENLTQIRTALAAEWPALPPWLLAKSTLHPTVYNRPAEEEQIRQAIARLSRQPGFAPGPDTDLLDGENRGGPQTRRHFTGIGQRRAALLWFAALWGELQRAGNH